MSSDERKIKYEDPYFKNDICFLSFLSKSLILQERFLKIQAITDLSQTLTAERKKENLKSSTFFYNRIGI